MRTLADKISKSNILLVCLICLLGFATHVGVLDAPFKTLDDSVSIVDNPDIKSFANVGKIFTASFFGGKHYYRPMVALSFMTEYHFFGLQPFFYNLTNLILHLSIAVTMFFLVFAVFKSRAVAFFSALLFAIHPIHWEAVANIPGRAIILCTFFAVNAFFVYCLGQGKKKFLVYYLASLVLFTCGLLSKESAAMLPVLLFFYILLVEKKIKKIPVVIPYFLIIAGYLVLRRSLGVMETYPWRSGQEHILGFLTFLRASLTWLRLFFWPAGLHFDRAQGMFLKFSDTGLLETLLAFLFIGIGAFKFRRHLSGKILFFAAWFWIELFPVSQIITTIGVGPGYISAAEHFLYMPSIGFFVLIVLGGRVLYRLNQEQKFISPGTYRILLATALLALMVTTAYQEIFARTSLGMFQRTLSYNPNNARILYSTGLEMVNRGRFREAEHYFRRAIEREALNSSYRIALGRALFDQGKMTESLVIYETVQDPGQWDLLLEHNISEAYQAVVEGYKQMIKQNPGDAQAYYSLGTVYSRHGDFAQGIPQYEKAVALKPDYKNALVNLASSCEALGQVDQALEYYHRVAALGGEKNDLDRYAYYRLGKIYEAKGEAELAETWLRKAEVLGGE